MMRSLFSGVSGLRAHQTRMDVIGNNIANVNTVGFKSGRVTFQEVFSQTIRGAGAPDAASGRGGINPMQIGLGIGVGSVDTITTRGSVQRTDNPTDLSIDGDGYFIAKTNSGTYEFTRAGNFGIDKLGNLVTGDGLNVYGWQQYTPNPDGTFTFDTQKQPEAINLYSDQYNKNKKMIAAKATTTAVFAGNLDASKSVVATPAASNVEFTIPVTVYDSLGNDYKVNVDLWKTNVTASGTTWSWQLNSSAGASSTASGTIEFDLNGQAVSGLSANVVLVPATGAGTSNVNVAIDFTKLTMFAADSSAKPTNVDGYEAGNLVTFNIGTDGILTGVYSNGQQQPLGMVALATFENPAGLQKIGNNMFIPTTNSGDFKKAIKPGTEGTGTLSPGTLEMSNVDLSKEFTEMIITQRGFQANSRIITTSDEMLQELVNLKR